MYACLVATRLTILVVIQQLFKLLGLVFTIASEKISFVSQSGHSLVIAHEVKARMAACIVEVVPVGHPIEER